MRHSSQRDFTVYEFKEDDEAIESASGRFMSRLGKRGNPRVEESAVSKNTFLKAFSEGKVVAEDIAGKIQRNFPTIEQACVMDEISVSSASYNMRDIISQHTIESQGLVPQYAQEDPPRMEDPSSMTPDSDDEQSNSALSDKQSNGNQVCVSSEDDGSCASSPDHADHEGSLESPASADCWTGFRGAEDSDMQIIVLAEYVIYDSELYAESRLLFFSDRIKIECLDESGKEFTSEWRITDIINISRQWSRSVGTTWVKVCLKPSIGSTRVAGVHDASVVRFCMPDIQWLDKEQKIMLLSPIYNDIFSTVSDVKSAEEEDEIMGPKAYISRHYLFDFNDFCEEVIYPKGDPDAVSISNRDLDLLQPETFVNDTIIDFYIKYLIDKIQPIEKHRFHFFNSFFFRKLADLDKDPSSAAEGRAAFLRVRKWTRKVNIFEKDYLFIPVNFNLHWSLLVICHPGEVALIKEESIHEVCRVPCILHMDSMKGSHSGLKDLVQSYLWEEWKERHQESLSFSNFSNLRFIPLELPQQGNSFDCGLFLLHYVELFLKEVPANFNPFKITKFTNFLNMDWFVPDEASHKRFVIRNLICDLLNDYQKGPQSSCGDWHCSEPSEKKAEKQSVEFLTTTCDPMKTDNFSLFSIAHDMDDNKISSLASPDHVGCDKEAGLPLHHLFEGKATRKTSIDSGKHILLQNSFHKIRSTLSPIEEEPSGQFVLAPQESSHPLADILNGKMAAASYGLKDVGVLDARQKLENSMEVEHLGDEDSSPDVTFCGSINSLEHYTTKMDVGNLQPDIAIDDVSHQRDEMEKQRSSGNCEEVPDSPSSVSREVLDTCVVEDSQKVDNTKLGCADCDTSSACCPETPSSCQEMGLSNKKESSGEENEQLGDEDLVPMHVMQHHKRQKVTHQ